MSIPLQCYFTREPNYVLFTSGYYFFVVYTFGFYVASKNVAFKTQLLTPPLLCTQMVFNKSFEEVMGLKSFSTNG